MYMTETPTPHQKSQRSGYIDQWALVYTSSQGKENTNTKKLLGLLSQSYFIMHFC